MALALLAPAGCSPSVLSLSEVLPISVLGDGPAVDLELGRIYVTRDETALKMDVFYPAATEEPTPAVVLVHGGFWFYGGAYMMQDWAVDLAAHGYTAASIDYRLLKDGYVYPAPVADVVAAIRHLRDSAEELNIDPERIGLFGVSSGGHLALLAGMADDRQLFDETLPQGQSAEVRAIVNIYGPTDFTGDPAAAELWQVGLMTRFLDASLDDDPQRWAEASPVTYAREDGPPVLTIHGVPDNIVPVTQARLLQEALEAAGQPHVYIELPWAGHWWGSTWASPPAQLHRPDILSFFEANL